MCPQYARTHENERHDEQMGPKMNETKTYWRTNHFFLPYFSLPPLTIDLGPVGRLPVDRDWHPSSQAKIVIPNQCAMGYNPFRLNWSELSFCSNIYASDVVTGRTMQCTFTRGRRYIITEITANCGFCDLPIDRSVLKSVLCDSRKNFTFSPFLCHVTGILARRNCCGVCEVRRFILELYHHLEATIGLYSRV